MQRWDFEINESEELLNFKFQLKSQRQRPKIYTLKMEFLHSSLLSKNIFIAEPPPPSYFECVSGYETASGFDPGMSILDAKVLSTHRSSTKMTWRKMGCDMNYTIFG